MGSALHLKHGWQACRDWATLVHRLARCGDHARDDERVHTRLEKTIAAGTFGLGAIKRDIGLPDELLCLDHVIYG